MIALWNGDNLNSCDLDVSAGFESDAMKTAHRYLQKKLRQERANLGVN